MEIVNVGNILSKVQEDLAKRGIKISEDRLMEVILKFVAEKRKRRS
jgi:methionine salvage enolase-phosphatase E1